MFEDFRLKVFLKVAECGNFTAASRALGVSQPAVSQNIAELEKTLGVQLFDRTRGNISLTEDGLSFKPYAERIMYWYGKAEAVIIRKSETPAAPVTLPLDGGGTARITSECGEIRIRLSDKDF